MPVSDSSVKWMEVLTSVVVPGVRRGLKQSTDLVKKGFVSLLASIVLSLGRPTQVILTSLPSSSLSVPLPLSSPEALTSTVWTQLAETFHSDLFFLLHEDPEQDFFENINHIQLHRRVRAFTKLRAILKAAAVASNSLAFVSSSSNDSSSSGSSSSSSSSASMLMIANSNSSSGSNRQDAGTAAAVEAEIGTGTASPEGQDLSISASSISSLIGIASISHVLLPLALHPLVSEEFKRKDHLTLLQESSAFVGAVGEGSTDTSTHFYIGSTYYTYSSLHHYNYCGVSFSALTLIYTQSTLAVTLICLLSFHRPLLLLLPYSSYSASTTASCVPHYFFFLALLVTHLIIHPSLALPLLLSLLLPLTHPFSYLTHRLTPPMDPILRTNKNNIKTA